MEKIVFFEIEEWEKAYILKQFSDTPVHFSHHKVDEETDVALFDATVISTFIYSPLNNATLDKFPNLKLIATRSTGFDHIDLSYCKAKGITIVNVPSYGAHSVAEYTFALVLAITKKLVPTIERTRRGNFSLDGLRGFDLYGKTIGIVGAGQIGKKVAEFALCFGMNVLIHTRRPEAGTDCIRYVSLDELLSLSDIVTLHVPYTPENHHFINRENIKQFKKGSILINTARGQLIETQAILDGLEMGILQFAGLDVLEEEGGLKEERALITDEYLKNTDIKTQLLNHILLDRDDVIFTSHNAFNSQEALLQILEITIENINGFLSQKVQNVVTT